MSPLAAAVAELADGAELHAVTGGTDDCLEVVEGLVRLAGRGCDLLVVQAAAGGAGGAAMVEWERSGLVRTLRVVVSTRMLVANALAGRVEHSARIRAELGGRLLEALMHAKFAVASVGTRRASMLTSANLTRNRRCEFYWVTLEPLVGEVLLELVADFERAGCAPGQTSSYYRSALHAAFGIRRELSEAAESALAELERWT